MKHYPSFRADILVLDGSGGLEMTGALRVRKPRPSCRGGCQIAVARSEASFSVPTMRGLQRGFSGVRHDGRNPLTAQSTSVQLPTRTI